MDAKSKASFINSIADKSTIPCPQCGAVNRNDGRFCAFCGAELNVSASTETAVPAFQEVKEDGAQWESEKYMEPKAAFAEGLPEWNIEPPQILVRRR